jgi:hypothetical protein
MKHMLASVVFVAFLSPAGAQQPPEGKRLRSHPAAAPLPALKYELLPELVDRHPGNAAVLYCRMCALDVLAHPKPETLDKLDAWLKTEPGKLPKEARDYGIGWVASKDLGRAARSEFCDWQFLSSLREDGIGMLIPEASGMRHYGNLLALRARARVGEGRLEEALHELQTGMSIARDIGSAPQLINSLVGVAIAGNMLDQVEALIQAPNSPNLYWALTDLPSPLIDFRAGFEGDSVAFYAMIPGLRESEGKPMTVEQAREQGENLIRLLSDGAVGPDTGSTSAAQRLGIAALVAKFYPEAKRFVLSQGRSSAEVEAMPMIQVVMIHALYQFRCMRDEIYKWRNVPFWHARKALQRMPRIQRLEQAGMTFFGGLLPAYIGVSFAQVRLDRRIAALRCIEAVRLYAAAHEGKLPAALADISEVPIPIDPVTGNAFDYEISGDTAVLSAAAPPREISQANNTIRYELTLGR